jgi:[protein-PII] uridylyltransferase
VLFPGDADLIGDAYDVLLAARVELHRLTGRHRDVLNLQDQDAVAAALGYAGADELMAAISAAARTIAWTSDESWRRVRAAITPPRKVPDEPLATGLFLHEGEVHLDDSAHPAADPTLVLRAAGAAARLHTRIDRQSLERLAAETPTFPDPWPVGASDDLAALLLCGHSAVPVLEAIDQRGLLVRILPEWAAVRGKPQRNAYHRFTVDRHLLEATANAATLADRVVRPDLLVFGALLHDLGKGYEGDHTDAGVVLANVIGPRLGLSTDDVDVVVSMVRHHLLLPDVATRRDLADDATILNVAAVVQTPLVLELLAVLTEADSLATGPSAWGNWKAELVAELVDRVAHVLGGGAVHEVAWSLFPSPDVLALMGAMRTSLRGEGDRLTVVTPDRPGVFARVAGVLALHGLNVLGAQAHSDEEGMAASEFRVALPPHGPVPWAGVVGDLERALDGRLALEARLAERAKAYDRRLHAGIAGPPTVIAHNDASSNATVLEVRCPDRTGVLYRIASALADMLLDIRHAKVQTLAHDVVDSFYVRTSGGEKVTDPAHLAEIERAIVHRVSAGVV